jgi:two-component system, NarL family, sensor histidine kinase UhpB
MFESEKPLNIMVIEDNPGDLILFKEYLGLSDLEVTHLYQEISLEKALAVLSNFPCDIVFLDLSLPDTDGVESFNRLNRLFPHMPKWLLNVLL